MCGTDKVALDEDSLTIRRIGIIMISPEVRPKRWKRRNITTTHLCKRRAVSGFSNLYYVEAQSATGAALNPEQKIHIFLYGGNGAAEVLGFRISEHTAKMLKTGHKITSVKIPKATMRCGEVVRRWRRGGNSGEWGDTYGDRISDWHDANARYLISGGPSSRTEQLAWARTADCLSDEGNGRWRGLLTEVRPSGWLMA